MFHGVSLRLLHNPPLEQITALLERLRRDRADAIAIIPHHYVSLEPGTPNLTAPPAGWQPPWFIYPDLGQDPTHPFHNTPEPELVLATARAAAGLGFQVMLKPHIDSYQAAWRGDISVQAKAADWTWGYRNRFLQRYLDIARQVDGAILCLGCELYTVTKELGAEFWIGLAQWVRGQGFKGPLTYAANWGGWADDAEYKRLRDLWPHLDYIGVDAYFPLVPAGYSGPLDVDTLVAAWHRKGLDVAWCPPIDDDLLGLSAATGKPLLFTEIGYANHKLAAENPMRDPLPTDLRDDDLQLRLAQAFRQRWGHEPAFAGYFWWEAFLDQATRPPIGHDILDRPIESVVFQRLPGENTAAGGRDPSDPNAYWRDDPAADNSGPGASALPRDPATGGVPPAGGTPPVAVPPHHIGWNDRPHGPAYPFESVPTISPTVFATVLLSHRSPALAQADAIDYYRLAMGTGLNPAVALAFFEHESQCGTDGPVAAAGANNWGNLRPRNDGSIGRAVRTVDTPFGTFRGYADYKDSLLDWCDLLLSPIYRGQTIRAALQIYAPASDQNSPTSYASIVLRQVAKWDQQSGDFDIPGAGPPGTAQVPDYPLLAAPSIPVSVFTAALTAAASPALAEADGATFFNLCVANGVDPAVALAFFQLESNCGTVPGAADRKNWGNLWDHQAGAIEIYPLWLLGLRDWCNRLQGPAYTRFGAPSIKSIVPIYGPALARKNGNDWYVAQLALRIAGLINALRGLAGPAGRDLAPPAGAAAPPPADHPVAGPPTISPAVFAAILQEHQSPALAAAPASDYYEAARASGVDPAVALAVFEHESACGSDPCGPGAPATARNWANLRAGSAGPGGRAAGTVSAEAGLFRAYATWVDGLRDWCDLMATPPYAGRSVREMLAVYAPGADPAAPNGYADTVLRRMAAWIAASGDFAAPLQGGTRDLASATSRDPGSAEQPQWVGASDGNFSRGRSGHTPIAIVNHEMQGTLGGTRQAFWDPAHQASAHYGVGRDGTVVQFVKEEDMAWANGPVRDPNLAAVPWIAACQQNHTNPNNLTISIEWEGAHDGDWGTVTWNGTTFDTLKQGTVRTWFAPSEAQYQAGLGLIRAIAARWHIPFDRAHICRHSDFDSVTKWFCPGQQFPMPRILADLQPAPQPPAPLPAPTPAPAVGYALLSPPTIPVSTFTQALVAAGSPVLAEANGSDYFQMCVANNVDPAVALAFFQQESNCGTLAGTAARQNWGTLFDLQANAVATYPSWLDGLRDWCVRLQGPAYTAHGAPTVASVVPIYQPAGAREKGNDWYIAQICARIDSLRGLSRDLVPAIDPGDPAGGDQAHTPAPAAPSARRAEPPAARPRRARKPAPPAPRKARPVDS